jgi:hypothetical protein
MMCQNPDCLCVEEDCCAENCAENEECQCWQSKEGEQE